MNAEKTRVPFKKKLQLSLIATLVMFCCGEAAVRIWNPHRRLPPAVPMAGPMFPWDTYHPTFGWINTPGYSGRHVRTNDFDVAVQINSKGIRTGHEMAYERNPGTFRAVIIGDSFTFGHGVDNDKTFAAVLESMIPGSEFLNAGVQGTGHDQQFLWLKEEGLKYKPDMVIWGFSSADIPRNVNTYRRLSDITTGLDYAKPRYYLRHGKLVLTNVPTPPKAELDRVIGNYLKSELEKRSLFNRIMRKSRFFEAVDDMLDSLAEKPEQVELTEAIALELANAAGEAKTPLLIVHLPVRKWLEKNGPIVSAKRKITEGILSRVSAKTGVPVLDLHDAFLANGRDALDRYFIKDGHYNEEGHKLVAEAIYGHIQGTRPTPTNAPGTGI